MKRIAPRFLSVLLASTILLTQITPLRAAGANSGSAAQTTAVTNSPQSGPSTAIPQDPTSTFTTRPDSYRIECGDVLAVSVYPADEISRDVIVQQDGKIAFPLISYIEARGKTVKQLEREMSVSLGRFVSHPQVTVAVKQFNHRQVFITGEVRSVGVYPYRENLRLLELISSCGGFTAEANRRAVRVYRGPIDKRMVHSIDTEAVTMSGDFSKDFVLEPGDVIEVPKGQPKVSILGTVRYPGYYEFRDNLRLLDLISQAGGFNDDAKISKVTILHDGAAGGSIDSIDLNLILTGKQKDLYVSSGDTVYIPRKRLATANWFANNILPWLSLVSIVVVLSRT